MRQQCQPDLGLPFNGTIPGDPGTTVIAVEPALSASSVTSSQEGAGGTINVNLTFVDHNSYLDIYVVLVILQFRSDAQACAMYKQSTSASTFDEISLCPDLFDIKGRLESCRGERVRTDAISIKTKLRIHMVFTKVPANLLVIQAWDRSFRSVLAEVQVPADLRPSILTEPTIPWITSLVAAIVGTMMLSFLRLNSNRLARIAERRAGRARAVLAGQGR